MSRHNVITVPFEALRSIFDDGRDEEALRQKIEDIDKQLLPTGCVNITDEQGTVIRSFTKDKITGITVWLRMRIDNGGFFQQ